jgi:5,10-methylenetetrahydromethanopterin reductase
MRIGVGLDTAGTLEETLERARERHAEGFRSLWSSQIFGPDTLTVLAFVGRELTDLDLGTAVIPVQPRHPTMLAAQARTVQQAIGGHLSLGVGLSHQVVVEGLWGLSFDRPATYMDEYVDALAPMLRGEPVSAHGERVRAVTMGPLGPKEVRAPSLLVAALGERMLEIAGAKTDGTVLWMTGPRTIAGHIKPRLADAAARAGRDQPRIVCSLPVIVTSDASAARERVDHEFATYATLPSYAAMLSREGVETPADVALIGSQAQVIDQLGRLEDAGVTEFSAVVTGTSDERRAARAALLAFRAD